MAAELVNITDIH